jgi:hypothetical protein
MSNLFEAEFSGAEAINEAVGVRVPASEPKKAAATSTPATPPAKASSAPSGNNKFIYVGLCATMNEYEQQLVKDKVVEYANQYKIELVGELKSAKLAIPGTVDKSMTPNQMSGTAKSKLDSDSNSVDTQGLIRQVRAGTQMIQFIEQIVRNSTYITGQQKGIVDSQTGNAKPNSSGAGGANTKWFKISVYAKPISPKIDKKRNDYAYSITYVVSPYQINQAESQYFPQAKYRGAHKVYSYWFTGENTQVLFYEQNYKALYFDVMDGKLPVNETGAAASFPGIATQWQNTRVPTTAAQENDQGATNGANNPASTLADYLYSIGDQGKVTLRIVGDPAWIQQGEVLGLDAASFNFNGFYPDGAINTDAQQPVFVLNWNAPADYNLSSGLMNVNASATKGNNNNLQSAQPAQSAAYQAMTIKSYFNKGKFEQELEGTLIKNLNQTQINNTDSARGLLGNLLGAPGVRDSAIPPNGSSAIFDESGKVSSIRRNEETGELYDGGGLYDTALPPPSASAPAGAPTSNGPILFQGSDDDGEAPESNTTAGQTMAPGDD